MYSSIPIKLKLSKSLSNAIQETAKRNGRSMESEIVALLQASFDGREDRKTDSAKALAAVGVVLGIE